MATHNLLCDVPHCSIPAEFFSLTENCAKEKSCNDHVKSLVLRYQTAYVIAAYDFIDSPSDADEYNRRKALCEIARENIKALIQSCDEEVKEALEAIDRHERKVGETVHRHFEEIRATVTQRQSALHHEFHSLQQNLHDYLAEKNTELTKPAALTCREITCRARFVGLGLADSSDDVGRTIVDSWQTSEADITATLLFLNKDKREKVTIELWKEAIKQSKQGVIEAIKYVLDYTEDGEVRIESAPAQFEMIRCGLLAHTEKSEKKRLSWLRQSWHLREKLGLQNRDTVAIGLKLAPLQALLCGEYDSAVSKLELCADIASRSLEALPVESAQAKLELCALYFHCGNRNKVQEVGIGLMEMGDRERLTVDQYWTTLFYLAHSADFKKVPETLVNVERWMKEREVDNSAICQMLKLMISALKFETLNPSVENIRLQAQSIANRHFPISIIAACNLAMLAQECDDDRRAIDYSKLSDRLYSVIAPMSVDAAHNLCSMSTRYCSVKAWNKSEVYLKRAQNIYREVAHDTVYEGNSYSQMGLLYCDQSLWTQAESSYTKAREIYARSTSNSLEAAVNFERMGLMYRQRKMLEQAREHYILAQCVYNEVAQSSIESGDNLMNIGKLNEELGSVKDAARYYDAAAAQYEVNHALDRQAEAQTCALRAKTKVSCEVF